VTFNGCLMNSPSEFFKRFARPAALRAGAVWALVLAGCAVDRPLRLELRPEVVRPDRSVIILWADGVDHQRFDELLTAGRLPNIQRVFVDGGVTVEDGVDSLPSVTYANGASLITGRFPGHHGIASNLWLDRQTLESTYYLTLASYLDSNQHIVGPTMFEILADHFTLNIHCHTRRGVSRSLDFEGQSGWAFAFGAFVTSDSLTVDRLAEAAAIANQEKCWPSVILVYCCGVDEIGHRAGPDSAWYQEAIENIDTQVGRLDEAVKAAGLAERTYFVLVSDHGMSPVRPERTIHLQNWLKQHRGLNVRCTPLTAENYQGRLREIGPYDAFVAVDSDRAACIHIRGKEGWSGTPEPAEIEAFLLGRPSVVDLPEVDCAAVRAGTNRVKVLSNRGAAIIERRIKKGYKQYRLTRVDGDPLGYGQDAELSAFIADGWHESRAWLAATARSERPDFVPQAVDLFDSPRMGDCVVFAAEEAAFRPEWLGGHGSCLRRDMHVVQLYAGPDLPAGTSVPASRFVDVAPTVIGLLGESDRLAKFGPLDGIDLSGQLKNAGGRTSPQGK